LDLTIEAKQELIEINHPDISVRRQGELLQLNRATYYYHPHPYQVSDDDLYLMNEVDRLYVEHPYYGTRKMAAHLNGKLDRHLTRKKMRRLMGLLGLQAIYAKPDTSKPHPEHTVYPYLLKGITAGYPNHIWGTDITYIRIKGSWMYLVAIMDWYSRYVISWQLGDSLEADFCIYNLEQALKVNIPKIHNSDQGSQFTSKAYIQILTDNPKIKISMDGRGRYLDNIFTERLWRSVKQEEIYLHDYYSPADVRRGLTRYFYKYNHDRVHEALNYAIPAEIYCGKPIPNKPKL
jgi:putative transposase